MAKLIIDDKEYDILDGSPILETAEEAGVPFGCQAGACGTCQIDIDDGAENLGELTKEETDMGMTSTHRLACQCSIVSGTVKISY